MPLSHPEVIDRLNRFFVPVYISNQDYRGSGAASAEERAELQRIHREGHAARLSVGTVHAFVLAPDGRLVDSLHVAKAFQVPALLAMLDGAVKQLGTKPGAPLLKPAPQSRPSPAPGALLLHVTARYLEKSGDDYRLIVNAGGNWSAFPGEAWISLDSAQQRRLLPTGSARPGDAWEPDRQVIASLLNHFYPPTENNDLAKNRIEEQTLRAVVLSEKDGVLEARLEGSLKMAHPFYHREDDRRVETLLAGILRADTRAGRVRSLSLVTDGGEYRGGGTRGQPFGAALRTVP